MLVFILIGSMLVLGLVDVISSAAPDQATALQGEEPGAEGSQGVPRVYFPAGPSAAPGPAITGQMPPPDAGDASSAVVYDVATGQETVLAADTRPVNDLLGDAMASQEGPAPDSFGSLTLISSPTSAPWNAVVRLEISHDELPSGTVFICTGVLVDTRHVLTSGNCVYDRSFGYGWATGIRAVPAYQSGATPYGPADATNYGAFTSWTQNGNTNDNVGYILLDRPVGALASLLPMRVGTDSEFTNSTFNNPGYPGADLNRPYVRSGRFDGAPGLYTVWHDQGQHPGRRDPVRLDGRRRTVRPRGDALRHRAQQRICAVAMIMRPRHAAAAPD
jgi:V8-like Glu-specific endopeptidase